VPVLCSATTKLGSAIGFNLFITKAPSYLATVFGVDIFKNGAFNAAATISQATTSLFAPSAANWLIVRFRLRSLVVRKWFQSLAMLGPAICLAMIPIWGCNATGVIVMLIGKSVHLLSIDSSYKLEDSLSASQLVYGIYTGGEWPIIAEFAPNSAGAVFGIASLPAYASGIVAPYLVGVLLDSDASTPARHQWNLVFFITSAIYVVGATVFVCFGTDQQQDWDKVSDEYGDDGVKEAVEKSGSEKQNYKF